ncbi:COP9 signalosome complex subunit 6 [Blyttiomyces sp. JEL0837]|nr:COP9 signalosome complex subunit 6 [Blyttiomyces sp. JEL0837]
MATSSNVMDVDDKKFVVDSSVHGGSGFMITLHPLVIMNVSDHFTRIRMQNGGSMTSPIHGVIIGTQSGRDLEIFNSYEVPSQLVDGNIVIDKAFFIDKQEQFRQVFPLYDLLGWYSVGVKPTAADIHVHQQFLEHNENPLFLQLNPSIVLTSRDLPINIYESIRDIADDSSNMLFIKTNFKIETGEAERIAVDHVAHVTSTEAASGSSIVAHLVGQRNAIKMLQARIKLLEKYVADVEAGVIPKDHELMRQITSICNRMPTIDGAEFQQEFLVDYNDVLLTTYLGTITKGTQAINDLVDKIALIGERKQGRMPRAAGGYFG